MSSNAMKNILTYLRSAESDAANFSTSWIVGSKGVPEPGNQLEAQVLQRVAVVPVSLKSEPALSVHERDLQSLRCLPNPGFGVPWVVT